MKRFILFAGDDYYPSGGWKDFRGDFNSRDEARDEAIRLRCDWYHIVDIEQGVKVLG